MLPLLGGVALGALDLLWIRYVPVLGFLGSSMAVWAVAAFLLTWRVPRWRLPSGVAAAVVFLVVAVPSVTLWVNRSVVVLLMTVPLTVFGYALTTLAGFW